MAGTSPPVRRALTAAVARGAVKPAEAMGPELLERITARRAELDELEEQPAKQPAEVRAERDGLAVSEGVLERVSERTADERVPASSVPAQVSGRVVLLIPHRTPDVEETVLPPGCQRILAVVQQAAGSVTVRQVGETLGVETSGRVKPELLHGKLVGLVDRGRLWKPPEGRFTIRL
ncbi:hypothetical protein [Streptomyces sp. Wb2n-11]|uniref:hypothetical protein n=1 Tax=Streptomyces sp. Wb2n-11 TaxID=1030533 RepID=UPI0021002E39|nr:hypothetical protein [Streptomyces sp. Wb2n-11]